MSKQKQKRKFDNVIEDENQQNQEMQLDEFNNDQDQKKIRYVSREHQQQMNAFNEAALKANPFANFPNAHAPSNTTNDNVFSAAPDFNNSAAFSSAFSFQPATINNNANASSSNVFEFSAGSEQQQAQHHRSSLGDR